MALPSLVAFGAIAQWPSPDRLDQVRSFLRREPSQSPLVSAIESLPALWSELAAQDAQDQYLASTDGKAAADDFVSWIKGTISSNALRSQGNVSQMPLTTLVHIMLYSSHLQQIEQRHEKVIEKVASGGGVQGFCIGLLSALAIASSKTEDEIYQYAGESLRLAFCTGLWPLLRLTWKRVWWATAEARYNAVNTAHGATSWRTLGCRPGVAIWGRYGGCRKIVSKTCNCVLTSVLHTPDC